MVNLTTERYTPSQQAAIYALAKQFAKEREDLGGLLETLVMFEGKKGRGKSLSMVAITIKFKEIFGKHIITVGAKLGLKPTYGPVEVINEKNFRDLLEKLTEVVDSFPEDVAREKVVEALRGAGVNIIDSVLVLDEAYKLLNSRTPMDKLVQVFGFFVAQMRHYNCTILIGTPHRDMIDKRVVRQVDWFGKCFFSKRTQISTVRFSGNGFWKLKIWGPTFYPLYETKSIIGYRQKSLEIRE